MADPTELLTEAVAALTALCAEVDARAKQSGWADRGELRQARTLLNRAKQFLRPTKAQLKRVQELRAKAKEMYCDGSDNNIEVDDQPMLSEADDGAWVSAWLWVADED